jgi:hypothetical protein
VEDKSQGLATCIQVIAAPVADLGACAYLNDCADMAHCFKPNKFQPGKCHFYCYVGQVDPTSPGPALGGCPAGQTCQTIADGVPLDFIANLPEIGLCSPAP